MRKGQLLGIITAGLVGLAALPSHEAEASSRIRAVVNKVPITDNEVRRRAAFLKLRRMKGNLREKALEELIDEKLQLVEARKLRIRVSDKEVDEAFVRFAKGNKIPLKVFRQILNRSGATPRGFKSYIRANMRWQRVVAARYGRDVRRKARPRSFTESLRNKSDSAKQSEEVTLQQVVFVVPKGKRNRIARRTKEAKAFRSRYPGCATAKTFVRGLRDVSVLDKGRMLIDELPRDWKKDVQRTAEGGTTKVKVTPKGVEFLAVCARKLVARSFDGPSEDVFREQAPKLAKKYMDGLRKKAKIVRR